MARVLLKKFRTAMGNLRIRWQFGRKSTEELQTELENITLKEQGDKARHTAGMQRKLLKQKILLLGALKQRGVELQ